MKTKFTLLFIFTVSFFRGFAQQPPNGGFEIFSDQFTAVGWTSVEDIAETALPIQHSIFTFQDTTTFTQGAASIKLVTDTIPTYSQLLGLGTVPGVISLGTGALDDNQNPVFFGIPFTYRPDSVLFDYKLTSPGIDTGAVNLLISKNAAKILSGADYLTLDSNWVHMAISLTSRYLNNNIPDTLLLQFASSLPTGNAVIGTTLHVDNVRFGYINPPILAIVTESASASCNGPDTLQANTGNGYTYQWSNNGSAIAGATNSMYIATTSGYYGVQIDSAASVAYSILTSVQICTGIDNITANSFSVYPNPTAGLLNINANTDLAGFTLQMFDVVGRVVITQTLTGSANTINVNSLTNGTYVYRIADKTNNVVSQNKFNVIK